MNTHDTKIRCRRAAHCTKLLPFFLALIPVGGHAFEYNAYEHYSFANCSRDITTVPPTINCDIPTVHNDRIPKYISGVTLASMEEGFEGDVLVCMRHYQVDIADMCAKKFVQHGEVVIFETEDLDFNWDAALKKGGGSKWWNWIPYIQLWDTELELSEALRGYKVFYDIP